ncbi:MAG: PCRF domain-containing protein [Candidatus Omnitrophica bacterium]|nr:PCRF domain-containing protein [Candidatus Omnitrophota bacterium]
MAKKNNYILEKIKKELAEAEELARNKDDSGMAELAREEVSRLLTEVNRLEKESAKKSLDRRDSRNAIVEVRAGTGGEEAALFAPAKKPLFLPATFSGCIPVLRNARA